MPKSDPSKVDSKLGEVFKMMPPNLLNDLKEIVEQMEEERGSEEQGN